MNESAPELRPKEPPKPPSRPAPVAFVPKRRRRTRTFIVVGVVVVAAVAAYLKLFVLKKGKKARQYVTAKVDRGPIEETVTATGTLQAVETVEVGAEVSGRIMKLGVDENAAVMKGFPIAIIDPEPYQARMEQAEAALAVAQATVQRSRAERRRSERERDRSVGLHDRGVGSAADADNAESGLEMARALERSSAAELKRAEAGLKAAKLDLDRTTIVSPIDGIVLARLVDEGQTVTSGFQTPTLYTIARDLTEMEVRAAIDEADVGKVHEGLKARFTVDAFPGEEFNGTILRIRRSPTVTQNVVTYEAIIRVANPEKKLWPGMTATVRVVTAEREDVVRIPNAALRFKPPKDMTEGMGKGGPGGPPGSKAEGERKGRRDRGDKGAKEGGGKGQKADGPKRQRRKVWKLEMGEAKPIDVELGVADENYTELVRGDIEPGTELVTEIPGGKGQGPGNRGGGGGGGGGGRGGGGGGGRMRF